MEARLKAFFKGSSRAKQVWLPLAALGAILLLAVVANAAANASNGPSVTLPAQVVVVTATPVKAHTVTKARTTHPATAVPGIVSEEQTPLNLTTATTSATNSAASPPWWQTLADISWKLGVVLILIWLLMRGMQALKQHGGTPAGDAQHFFEKLDELSLGPSLTLLAVRAGGRVLLLARSASGVQTLGEFDDAGEESAEPSQRALPSSFTGQLWRAWAKLSAPSADVATGAASSTPAPDAPPSADVVEARWVHVPGDTPAATVTEMGGALPLRRGVTRDGDQPEPLSPAREREILWHAETNGDASAAKKYGLTRQRVTAMRLRRDREQPDAPSHEGAPSRAGAAGRVGKPVEHPIVPDGQTAPEPISLAAARQSAARSAYRAASSGARATTATEASRATTVGQILASRFGVKSAGKAEK